MSDFILPDNGFNRYMAVDPQGVPQWESDFAAGTCESDAWFDFIGYRADEGFVDYFDADESEGTEEAMQKLGWRMIECEPRPVKR